MKNKMKYFTASLIILLMAFSLLSGCSKDSSGDGGKKDANDTGNSEFTLGEDQLEYTMYGHYDWYTMPNLG